MTAQLFVFPFAGLVFIGLGLPLALRKVAPNGKYGLRVPATFADPSVWYEANAASGRDLILAGVAQIVAWAVFAGRPDLASAVPAIAPIVVAGTAAVVVGVGWWRANRLLARRQGERR